MFESVDDVISKFSDQKYICNRQIATVVYLASQLRKPILVEGPAGVKHQVHQQPTVTHFESYKGYPCVVAIGLNRRGGCRLSDLTGHH